MAKIRTKMRKGECKIVRLGKGRGIRHLCNGPNGPQFVTEATYRRLKRLSGTGSKKRKTKKRKTKKRKTRGR